jgi:hypothetical protein
MGAKFPPEDINKDSILKNAAEDGFRGEYVKWGNLHSFSMVVGALGGGLFVFGAYLIDLYN